MQFLSSSVEDNVIIFWSRIPKKHDDFEYRLHFHLYLPVSPTKNTP